MLIDMHAHSAGISRCCRADAKDVMLAAQAAGIDALVLCNHYDIEYVTSTPAEFAERYVNEYYYAEKCAREVGIKLFFGVEISARKHNNFHILVYGMEPSFALEHPDMYELSLEELLPMVHAKGGLVVQAHPFRGRTRLLDTALLDGVEVNCHPLYDATHCDELIDIAEKAGILVTCGGDYHADTYRAVCGVHFPEDTETWSDIIGYLTSTPEIRMHVQELRCAEHGDVVFRTGR